MYVKGIKTFIAAAAIAAKRLVKFSAATVAHNTATDTDEPIGIAEYGVGAGEAAAVRMINDAGTFEVTAAGAIDAGEAVFAADDGKVQALPVAPGTYRRVGIALEAAVADGDIIEILPYAYTESTVVAG